MSSLPLRQRLASGVLQIADEQNDGIFGADSYAEVNWRAFVLLHSKAALNLTRSSLSFHLWQWMHSGRGRSGQPR